MTKISKRTIAQTFKFNCDRYLRFELSTKKEKEAIGIEGIELGKPRPGLQLMVEAGSKWEADKYHDLIDCIEDKASILYKLDDKVNERLGTKPFKHIYYMFDALKSPKPPYAILEGSFKVPLSVSDAFKEAHEKYNLELSDARPDIILVRPYPSGAPLIKTTDKAPKYELHIIDVKMASEASLKHFTEVTYYAFALAEAIKEQGLDSLYQVSGKGLIWPGSHDNNEFRNLYKEFKAKGEADPLMAALHETLEEVPYEIYEVHVRNFLDQKFLAVMGQSPKEASWHLSPKCQLCQYLEYCQKEAIDTDHLSRIPWMNQGQADVFRQNNITTTKSLLDSIEQDSEDWKLVKSENYQLKADQFALNARSKALYTNQPEIIKERKCGSMPEWANMNIYLTLHFDPGTGITFAMGARKVYFPTKREKGDPPLTDERMFIVDKADSANPDTEKNRMIEFIDLITGWFMEADAENIKIREERKARGERDRDAGKATAHVFFWNQLEVTQLLRMIERHMTDPKVVDRIELLIRLFPPSGVLPDAESFKSQPGTIVKSVLRQLIGLPISHDYTLLDSANAFYPSLKEDGTPFMYSAAFGFKSPLQDQIPFERAYELWKDDVFLRHYKKKDGSDYTEDEQRRGADKFTRDEVYEGLKKTVKTHLSALEHIVGRLREHCKGQLTLKKSGFSAAPPSQLRVPEKARQLITFQKLEAISRELENGYNLSLPIQEKEARFISMRNLLPTNGSRTTEEIEKIRSLGSYNNEILKAFSFSPESKDAKIKEGDFLCALSNEEHSALLMSPWYISIGIDFNTAKDLMDRYRFKNFNMRLCELLQVTVVKICPVEEKPFVILQMNDRYFKFIIDNAILDLSKPMMLDNYVKDFDSEEVEDVLRMVGGKAPSRKATR